MKSMLNRIKRFVIIGILALAPLLSIGQPSSPGGGDDPGCYPPPCVPIDGGLSFLLAAGAMYGGKKAYDYRKKIQDEEE